MNIYCYDIEVFAHDWIVVFRNVEDTNRHHVVIHNNNYQLREFIDQSQILLGGFNNKSYDDWIVQSMLNGADNAIVKNHNDWIIEGKNGWEFPFIQYQRKYFRSFDLRDDLPLNVSLKSIEGNMMNPIVESSVPFDIDRPLTPAELDEVIRYCKTDVDNTVTLYHTRKKYLDTKRQIARIKGMDEFDAMGLTNAKLTARFLDAKRLVDYDDEMVYQAPDELRIGRYNRALEFFNDPVGCTLRDLEAALEGETRKIRTNSLTRKISKLKESQNRYDCKLEMMIAGVPHVLGWGGIHGALKNYIARATATFKIVTIDVGSYYPSLMLEYNYISRNIPSAAGYAEVYHTRLDAKHRGDKATADALKLILNTCYGAMKNPYNDLYDPRNASAVCITGMLLLTDLIDKLENVPGFQLIQSNTDGIIIGYPIQVEKQIEAVVSEWEARTRLNMEYTVIHAIAQKDVNNYVMKAGETYMIRSGERIVTEPDKGKLKMKGGYVSLAGGGDFKNNSTVVLHKALVEYFMNDVPIEKTIRENNNLADYQIIAKTGSTYDGTYWEVNGKKIEVQRVNRVYASRSATYGTIYKLKGKKLSASEITLRNEETGRSDKIASLPDHCVIDNENKLTIDDIDKQFYIDLAYKRASDYLGAPVESTKKKEKEIMAETKKNVWQKLITARLEFLQSDVKKTGINRFAEFKYFELADIVPTATKIFEKMGLVFITSFENGNAVGVLVNTENPTETITFYSPMRELTTVSQTGKNKMNELQGLGAEETYQRRYLYMMCLDIVEADTVDATSGESSNESKAAAPKKPSKNPAIAREEAKKDLIDADGSATEVQIKSIKNGLKKLREKSDDEDYIKSVVGKIKKGLSKKDAEGLLIEIGEKIEA